MSTGAWVVALLAAVLAALAVSLVVPGGRRTVPRRERAPGGRTSSVPRPGVLRAAAAGGAGLAALLLVPGVPGVLGAAVAGAVVWVRAGRWEGAAARNRREALEAEVPHVVDLLVAALHAGAAPAEALGRVAAVTGGPMGEELEAWLARLRLGADPVVVWRSMADHPQLGRLGATLARSVESGAPVAEALARLSDELADRARSEVEARVRQVEVKAAVPLGVCLLPAFVVTGVVPLVAGAATSLLG